MKPCLNNGTCTDMINGYSCQCDVEYSGTNCSESKYRSLKNLFPSNFGKLSWVKDVEGMSMNDLRKYFKHHI